MTIKNNMVCAPGKEYIAGSCARLSVLVELANAYNNTADNKDKIKLSRQMEIVNPQKYKSYLVEQIGNRVGDKCKTQKCWTTLEFTKHMNKTARDEFQKYTFRPDSPQGKYTWLSTVDINNVMAQYEQKYKDFKFLGAVPMDFARLPSLEASNINYDKCINDGKHKLGIVFNLDYHNQPGSHWVAMYTDLNEGNIYYYDSVGKKPSKEVRKLMREQIRYLESKGKKLDNFKVDYNATQHQYQNTECGVYSMNFLIRMAGGDDFYKYCGTPISDTKINKCRKVYFDKYSRKK
jgi:hypothetical protein